MSKNALLISTLMTLLQLFLVSSIKECPTVRKVGGNLYYLTSETNLTQTSESTLPGCSECMYSRLKKAGKRKYCFKKETVDLSKTVFNEEADFQQCGRENLENAGRIVGGVESAPHQFPWMVRVVFYNLGNGGVVVCGGTLISARAVLSAAHCIPTVGDKHVDANMLGVVILGSHNYKEGTTEQNLEGYKIPIMRSIVHPGFSHATAENDIALLILSTDVKFSREVGPVCMPDPQLHTSQGMDGTAGRIVGWGKTKCLGESLEQHLGKKMQRFTLLTKEKFEEETANIFLNSSKSSEEQEIEFSSWEKQKLDEFYHSLTEFLPGVEMLIKPDMNWSKPDKDDIIKNVVFNNWARNVVEEHGNSVDDDMEQSGEDLQKKLEDLRDFLPGMMNLDSLDPKVNLGPGQILFRQLGHISEMAQFSSVASWLRSSYGKLFKVNPNWIYYDALLRLKDLYIHGPGSSFLKYGDMKLLSSEECGQTLNLTIKPSWLCAERIDAFFGSGDSGGPLVIKSDDDHYVLVGVSSFGVGDELYFPPLCHCNCELPGVFSRVTASLSWIHQTLDKYGFKI